jgi:hypothetical protein
VESQKRTIIRTIRVRTAALTASPHNINEETRILHHQYS